MQWNPTEHSDQDNLTWSWLRAVEWGRWPLFISQPVAPILLVFLPWKHVVIGTVVTNILWAIFIRYTFVSVPAASFGVYLAKLKWITCPFCAVYLFATHETVAATLSLLWPLVIVPLGILPTTQIGRLQKMFMSRLGCEPRDPAPGQSA